MHELKKTVTVQPMWTSYIQGLKAISDYFDLGHSVPRISGTTGYAFIMNISADLCPSGPTAFCHIPQNEMAANLGLAVQEMFFDTDDPESESKSIRARQFIKDSIDADLPVIVWGLKFPEYYLVRGYDKNSLIFYDLNGAPSKTAWDNLSQQETGFVSIITATASGKVAGRNKLLKDVFEYTLKFAGHPKDLTYPIYTNGLKAYNTWIDALESGKYNPMGLGYNTQVWAECRINAFNFLKEIRQASRTKILDGLLEHYEVVSWSLQKVAKLIPIGTEELDPMDREQAIDTLFLAQEAEKSALAEMRSVLSQL